MKKNPGVRRHSGEELLRLRAKGGSKTDLKRIRAKTQDELESDIAADGDWRDIPADWHKQAEAIMPVAKRPISIRLDCDVLNWFKRKGRGYQTRINAALRAYMKSQTLGK
jgi:uncharacterized protein (DUF4415 family)